MDWYVWAFGINSIFTSLLSFFSLLWCLTVLFYDVNKRNIKSYLNQIKTKQLTTVLSSISLLVFISSTFVFIIEVPVTPDILWRSLINKIPMDIISILVIVGITKLKLLEDRMETNVRNRLTKEKILDDIDV